jgi:hypothetical protein
VLPVFWAPANLKTLAAQEHGRTVKVACAGAQSRRHDDPNCSVRPLRLRFLFHLKDVSPECAEFLFKVRLRKRAVAVGQLQSDICPVFWPQRVEHGWKHDALLHGHVLPLVADKVANDVVYGLAQEILNAWVLPCLPKANAHRASSHVNWDRA